MSRRYFEISVAHSAKIGIFAETLSEAKAEADRLYQTGCDAEYCGDDNCTKDHYHTLNCRCPDCMAADDDFDS